VSPEFAESLVDCRFISFLPQDFVPHTVNRPSSQLALTGNQMRMARPAYTAFEMLTKDGQSPELHESSLWAAIRSSLPVDTGSATSHDPHASIYSSLRSHTTVAADSRTENEVALEQHLRKHFPSLGFAKEAAVMFHRMYFSPSQLTRREAQLVLNDLPKVVEELALTPGLKRVLTGFLEAILAHQNPSEAILAKHNKY